jgi:hypothetical protein
MSNPAEKIRCDACPVNCYIAEGRAGACDRYANHGGDLVRLDMLTIIDAEPEALSSGLSVTVDFESWSDSITLPVFRIATGQTP